MTLTANLLMVLNNDSNASSRISISQNSSSNSNSPVSLLDAEDLAGNWRFQWPDPYISSRRCWTIIRGLPYQKRYCKKSWFCSFLWKYENGNSNRMEFVTSESDPKKTNSIMEDDYKNLLKTFFKIEPAYHPGILRETTSENSQYQEKRECP